jgi:hypothetical protein
MPCQEHTRLHKGSRYRRQLGKNSAGSDNISSYRKRNGMNSLVQHHIEEMTIVWGCKFEWFDRAGNSLGFSPNQVLGLLSPTRTLHSTLVGSIEFDEEAHSSSFLHLTSDATRKRDSPYQLGSATTLQNLLFKMRGEMDYLKFHIELMQEKLQDEVFIPLYIL